MNRATALLGHRRVENSAKNLQHAVRAIGRQATMPRLLLPVIVPLGNQRREGVAQLGISTMLVSATILLRRLHHQSPLPGANPRAYGRAREAREETIVFAVNSRQR